LSTRRYTSAVALPQIWTISRTRGHGSLKTAAKEEISTWRSTTHLLTESGYALLTLQEKADIVKAFGFCKSLSYLKAVTRFNNYLP
jgi:hypothetical protein